MVVQPFSLESKRIDRNITYYNTNFATVVSDEPLHEYSQTS